MSDKILKIISCLLSLVLLVTLILKLQNVPGGMILSWLFLGGMIIIGILLGCIPIAALLKLLFKKNSFFTLYSISTVIALLYFHYYLYSPTLKIIVPEGYSGQVCLVLSNVKDNVLTLDTNGIGYINQWTFDHTYSIQEVTDEKAVSLKAFCIGYDPSTFWAKWRSCCVPGKEIADLNFEIVPKPGQRRYYTKDISAFVNKNLVIFVK
jgi:hypothetical protein